jgi:hypothetical protein
MTDDLNKTVVAVLDTAISLMVSKEDSRVDPQIKSGG